MLSQGGLRKRKKKGKKKKKERERERETNEKRREFSPSGSPSRRRRRRPRGGRRRRGRSTRLKKQTKKQTRRLVLPLERACKHPRKLLSLSHTYTPKTLFRSLSLGFNIAACRAVRSPLAYRKWTSTSNLRLQPPLPPLPSFLFIPFRYSVRSRRVSDEIIHFLGRLVIESR